MINRKQRKRYLVLLILPHENSNVEKQYHVVKFYEALQLHNVVFSLVSQNFNQFHNKQTKRNRYRGE